MPGRIFTPQERKRLDAFPSEIGEADLIRFHASILAQACNFGLTRMAQLADLSYRQLARCTTWYLREETLQPAIASIVNQHYRYPLARLWGGGTLSSSDGQRFPVAVRSHAATAIPRYYGFGTGLTFYTWTSDQPSQCGSKPIPSTVRDSTYVLDGVLDNETELPIAEHTTDTAGYTDLVFGLFDLLGLQFSPRLRDLADQTLRLNKTIFILRYLLSEQVQRRIGAQINKGEALHALRGFLFLANEGKIRRRYYEEQLNQVDDADVAHLWPARYAHINPYGKYRFNVDEDSTAKVFAH